MKQITIIYDESDVIENNNGIMTAVRKIADMLGIDKKANGDYGAMPHAETLSVIGRISFNDVEIKFVHESMWDYDNAQAEKDYGVTETRSNTVFNSNLDVCVKRIQELLN